jgi:hypothetical protein
MYTLVPEYAPYITQVRSHPIQSTHIITLDSSSHPFPEIRHINNSPFLPILTETNPFHAFHLISSRISVRLGLQIYPPIPCMHFSSRPISATCHARLIHLGLINRMIFGEEVKPRSSSLLYCLQNPVTLPSLRQKHSP